MPQFVKDVEEIRQRAIRKIEDGAVTETYGVDKEHAINILNEALATEIVCVLRYMHHYFMATGVHGKGVADEFKEHADSEREHADSIAERIQQLGGKPDMNPGTLVQRSVSQYIEGETLGDMIREDLIAERVVIDVYTDMIRFFGDKDPVTRRMLEEILTDEEEHASDLSDLLYIVDPHTGKDRGQDPGTDPLSIHDGKKQERDRNEAKARESEDKGGVMNRNQEGRQGRGSQGISNRQATEELERGALKSERGSGKSLGSSRGRSDERQEGGNNRDNSAMRPERAARSDRPAANRGGELETANTPGATGRPTRKRAPEIEDTEAGSVREGGAAGMSRAVRSTNPNRKRKKVA